MSGPSGPNAAVDHAAAAAAALRGAALAFDRQKKADQQQQQQQQRQQQVKQAQQGHQQHLPPPTRPRRLPSVSPSRDSTASSNTNLSTNQAANALLAATSATAGRAGSSMLRPISPGQMSTASGNRSRSHSTSNSNGQSRSRSRGRNAVIGATDFGSSPSSGISPSPAIGRVRTGGNGTAGGPTLHGARSTSFLAATLAASQAASPRMTPSHTGQFGGTSAHTTGSGPVPTHLSAALLASAASDERQRAAKAVTAANRAAAEAASNEDMIRRGIYIGGQQPVFDEEDEVSNEQLDTSAIPATSSLVSMFEKEKNGKRGTKTGGNSNRSPARPPKQKTFTPPRSLSPEPTAEVPVKTPAKTPAKTPLKTPTNAPAKPPTKPTTKPSTNLSTKPPTIAVSSNTPPREAARPKPQPKPQPKLQETPQPKLQPNIKPTVTREPQKTKPIPIPKPKPQSAAIPVVSSSPLEKVGRLERASTSSSPLGTHRKSLRDLNDEGDVMERPKPPNPRTRNSSVPSNRSLPKDDDATDPAAHRAATFSSRGPPPLAPPRRSATALVARHTGGSSPRRQPSTTTTSVDSMASAIMAGSLAAARHPPSIIRSPSTSLPSSRSRTPPAPARSTSPTKRTGMLQTLRRDKVHSDDDDYDRDGTSSGNTQYRRSHYHRDGRLRQGKHHFSQAAPIALVSGGRHKHKHHEGARRRWHECVTDRQRKRYEAVWASNRGNRGIKGQEDSVVDAVDAGSDDDDTVPNVVVRDLWRRSRLPADELAEVWDLVDETGTGRLGKAGFVVGLWLIDQRLRGRKIPARVSESVWSSARGMQSSGKPRKR
ncbi:Increased rDNA silencing protein [Sporothrix eucalyptigena]